MSNHNMLELALQYLRSGYCVIPKRPGAKAPLIKWMEFQTRPPTEAEIYSWWSSWPDAGIAVLLGPISRVVVVDSDSEEAHQVFLDNLGGAPNTLCAISGSRGPGKYHYYYRAPAFPTGATFKPWHRQLEFRGAGGYIIVPPSLHPSGLEYAWLDPATEIAPLPDILAEAWRNNPRFIPALRGSVSSVIRSYSRGNTTKRDLLQIPHLAKSTAKWLLGDYAQAPGWNHRLYCAACDLHGLGVSRADAESHLLRGAEPNTDQDERSARATIESAYSSGRRPFAEYPNACPNGLHSATR